MARKARRRSARRERDGRQGPRRAEEGGGWHRVLGVFLTPPRKKMNLLAESPEIHFRRLSLNSRFFQVQHAGPPVGGTQDGRPGEEQCLSCSSSGSLGPPPFPPRAVCGPGASHGVPARGAKGGGGDRQVDSSTATAATAPTPCVGGGGGGALFRRVRCSQGRKTR